MIKKPSKIKKVPPSEDYAGRSEPFASYKKLGMGGEADAIVRVTEDFNNENLVALAKKVNEIIDYLNA